MPDLGEKLTDIRVERIKKELARIYSEASKDLHQKALEFTKRFEAKDKEKKAELDAGKISKQEYERWRSGQVFIGKRWNAKVKQMAQSMVQVEQEALRIVQGEQVECFAENTNYFEFRIDKDFSFGENFTLYDRHTVTTLVRDEPELLRRRVIKGKESEAWNAKIIRNCITQGIIQGESIPDIAKRMARDTASTDMKAMVRYARTAMTGAQNAGRLQAMRETEKMGITVWKVWLAVADDRTRDAHLDLDGQSVPISAPFESILGAIMYPGDPSADDANVWNCRCALGYEYPDRAESVSMYSEGYDEEYDDEEDEFAAWIHRHKAA